MARRVEEESMWLGGNRTQQFLAVLGGVIGGCALGGCGGAIIDSTMAPESESPSIVPVEARSSTAIDGSTRTVTAELGEENQDLVPFGVDITTFVGATMGAVVGYSSARMVSKDPELIDEIRQAGKTLFG